MGMAAGLDARISACHPGRAPREPGSMTACRALLADAGGYGSRASPLARLALDDGGLSVLETRGRSACSTSPRCASMTIEVTPAVWPSRRPTDAYRSAKTFRR